jgi:hypothetical protein
VHPKQSETFTAIEGALNLRVDKQRARLARYGASYQPAKPILA